MRTSFRARPRTPRALAAAALAVAALGLPGCHDDAPPIGLVSGTVTHGGKPVPNLTVSFMPENGRPSWGMTDSAGRYVLHWDEDHDGAEVGRHKVSVAYVPGSQTEEAGRSKTAPKAPEGLKDILARYGIETTTLSLEVKRGRQTIDLPLD